MSVARDEVKTVSPIARKPWAVLAYTVADDKSGGSLLDEAAMSELKALCDAADFDSMSIAAQVDFKRTTGVYRGSITEKPRDFVVVRAAEHPLWQKILGGVKRSRLRVLKEKIDLNAARRSVLEGFLRFGRDECPAERYVVFFYGHAYGPLGLFYDAAGTRPASTLRLNDLASAIAVDGGKAAVVVFRDCFMNTLETAYQLRHAADTMIASQSVVPVAGVWPWARLLTRLTAGASSIDVGLAMAREIASFLDVPANRGPFADVPCSLLDLEAAEEIVAPLAALTTAIDAARDEPRRARACAAALEAARFGRPDDAEKPGDPALIDVPTMCEGLAAGADEAVAGPARALGGVVRDRLVRWHHSQQQRFRGTSLYYKPVTARDVARSFILSGDEAAAAKDAAHYETLALCRATGWHRVALNPIAKQG